MNCFVNQGSLGEHVLGDLGGVVHLLGELFANLGELFANLGGLLYSSRGVHLCKLALRLVRGERLRVAPPPSATLCLLLTPLLGRLRHAHDP